MTFKIAHVADQNTDEVYLRLIELDKGGVLLRATTADGVALDHGNILKINAAGELRLYQNTDVPGLQTVEGGVVRIGKDCFRQPIDRRREGKSLD
jgi:hypothetical protein